MAEVMAKGQNFLYAREFIQKEYGSRAWTKLLEGLPGDAAELWNSSLSPMGNYSFFVFKAMVSRLAKETGKLEDAETSRMYEYIAERSLHVLYKVFLKVFHKFANPSFVIRSYPNLWGRFFNAGKVEVPVAEKGHAIVKFVLPDIFLDWLAPACLGYSKTAIKISGGRNLTMKQISKALLANDLWEIQYDLRWEE